jgi:hypothetical protein
MKQSIIIAFASLALLFSGCSTPRLPDYPRASPSASERTIQKSGVQIALDPFVEADRTKKYFGTDAAADGIAILHVRIANDTSDQTFLVEKEDFQLLPGGAENLMPDQKIDRPNVAAHIISGVAVGSILSLIESASVSKSSEIQRNLTSKEMGDATISPGKSMEGFIYYQLPTKGGDWTRFADVKINLTETRSRQVIALDIPLSH